MPFYLKYLMSDTLEQPNLKKFYEIWRKNRAQFPFNSNNIDFNRILVTYISDKAARPDQEKHKQTKVAYQMYVQNRGNVQYSFVELFVEFLDFVVIMINEQLSNESKAQIQQALNQKFPKFGAVFAQMVSNPNALISLKDSLQAKDITKFFSNFIVNECINFTMFRFEERAFRHFLPTWPYWEKLDMKMFPIDEGEGYNFFDVFKQMLLLVGELNVDSEPDLGMFEFEEVKMFKENNRRIVL